LKVTVNEAELVRRDVSRNDLNATLELAKRGLIAGKSIRLTLGSGWSRNPKNLAKLPILSTPRDSRVTVGDVATFQYEEAAASIKSENGQLRNYVRLNVRGRDPQQFIAAAKAAIAEHVALPAGVSLIWTGQFEHQQQSQRRLALLMPIVLLLILCLLWWTYHDLADAALVLLAIPGALAGGLFMQWLCGTSLSVTVLVGYIACFGMAASTGVIMLVYLREAVAKAGGLENITLDELRSAVLNGAVQRLRPKLLTEATTVIGLAPMLWASGIGSEVIRPMAAPVLGGILVADEVIDLFLPVAFYWVRKLRWQRQIRAGEPTSTTSPELAAAES
jgi:Cu(I)/Ag(I) efflux system membrane protein CusA/SilA